MTGEKKEAYKPGLYVVATPIGNLGDVTRRAVDILENVDVVLCEDTRQTGKLMAALGIRKPLFSYHDHNADKVRPEILARLEKGACLALVSDAGTPLISDPGYKLVRDARDAGIFVTAAPGPSSVMAALVVSGLPTDRFLFAGFLPEKAGARARTLNELGSIRSTLVFFESARRLSESLGDMATHLGRDRPVAVARELTKLYEEVRRGTLVELAAFYAEGGAPKGEVVVIVGPPEEKVATADDADGVLRALLAEGVSVRDASEQAASATGLSRKALYTRALELRDENV